MIFVHVVEVAVLSRTTFFSPNKARRIDDSEDENVRSISKIFLRLQLREKNKAEQTLVECN